MTLRLAIVNPVWAPDVSSADAVLARYHTLTGWARAVGACGIDVSVIQRLPVPGHREIDAASFHFVADTGRPLPAASHVGAVASAVEAVSADVVHINGVVFPRWVRALRRRLGTGRRLVVQDHGGWHPEGASRYARWKIRRGLSVAEAVLLSSQGQVEIWRTTGTLPRSIAAFDVMESSVDLQPIARDRARRESGLNGAPAVLCVGRLTRSKDPMTVIEGFARFLATRPEATLTWVYQGGALESVIQQAIASHGALARRVQLVGSVPHQRMAAYYSAADILVSASRAEGSGYAALEAMACGTVPVLTDIAPFRAMIGDARIGALWTPGDARACARALMHAAAHCDEPARIRVRARFEAALSWPVIGQRAADIYRAVWAR